MRHVTELNDDEASALDWCLRVLGGSRISSDEVAEHLAPGWRNGDALVGILMMSGHRLGDFDRVGARRLPDGAVEAALRDRRNRSWSFRVRLDDRARILGASVFRPAPAGVTIRPVGAVDWPALAELERSCPIVDKHSSTWLQYGASLEQHFELQGEYALQVAETGGRLIGARAFSVREGTFDGVASRLCYSHFVRVHPDYQSQGLFLPLNAMAFEAVQRTTDGIFAYMSPDNDVMRAALGTAAGATGWPVYAKRLMIRCADHATPVRARRGCPGDATLIADLVNACHKDEGFFSEYDADSVAERLTRVPGAYGFSDLLVGSRAVAGVWLSGERRREERDGETTRSSVRAPVLDYGFDGPAGLDELVDLLTQWCSVALEAGSTHLAVFSSDPSPGFARLAERAEYVEPYEFLCVVPAPRDLEERGLYVDPLHF